MRRLVIRPGAIGDCILWLPALECVVADYTEVWAPSAVVPLIRVADRVCPLASTGIDTFAVGDIESEEGLIRRLRGFDSIVSWYGANRPEFREALANLGVPCQFHAALPPADYAGHTTDFFAQQVGAPCGLIPRIRIDGSAPRETVVIHPFSGSALKNWPLVLYQDLAARLPYAVEWTAGPEEELPGATRFANLGDLAAWLKGARLYIGNDSGITHLAAACGVPTLTLFGPLSPKTWEPRGENVVVLREPLMESVLNAANRLLGLP
jgi:ADP-heptose:LPS heptosyltransferase